MFWYVTLPNIKWGLLYGVLLCNARAMGEFGAVSVVSGKKAGQTDTLPISIEKLYQGIGPTASASAFAVAGLLAGLALVTLVLKTLVEWQTQRQLREAANAAGKARQ
jgi:sulfate transport system permease protein